ncbi:MAG: DUF4214 domain-containing protein [Acidimicrobiales bacterium]
MPSSRWQGAAVKEGRRLRRRSRLGGPIALLAALLCAVTLTVTPAGAQTDTTAPDTTAADTTSPEAPAAPVGDEPVDPADDPGVRGSVERLYGAVFGRSPDQAGFDYWVDVYVAGTPLTSVAREFMASPEWTSTYGDLDNAAFVHVIYSNVLGREPDEAGYAYWLGLVDGGLSRTKLLLGFSESPEYVTATGTAAPVAPPPVFEPLPANSGSGRRIVYSNTAQRVWWVESDGRVSNSYLVSGRDNVPDPATYSIYSKSPIAYAGHNGITMKHMVRFTYSKYGNRLPIGFHSIPRYANGTPMQTVEQLGTYQSAGCVRQRDDQAEALYQWARLGDTVVVLP